MKEPTRAQWREMHVAFSEFCRAEPWDTLDDTDVIIIEHPSGQYMGYCTIMGASEMEYGLTVFMGDKGLAAYLELALEEPGPRMFDRMNALIATLGDRKELDARERAAMRRLGLRYRGRDKWPIFRSLKSGFLPWRLNEDETLFMTAALRNVVDVVSRIAAGELSLYRYDDPDRALVRILREGVWRDQWERLMMPDSPAPTPYYTHPERLRRIARTKPREASIWEVGISYIHASIQEERESRPYFPTVALIVDSASSLVLGVKALGASPSGEERQNALVELLESVDSLPSEIVVDSEEIALLVASVALQLDIGLSAGRTPALDAARESLLDHLA